MSLPVSKTVPDIIKGISEFSSIKNSNSFYLKSAGTQKKTEEARLASTEEARLASSDQEKRPDDFVLISDLHVEKVVVKNQEHPINGLSQTAKKVMLFSFPVIFAITLALVLRGNFLNAKTMPEPSLNSGLENYRLGFKCEHSYPPSCTPEETFHYYKLAADNGDDLSQYIVASAYRHGKWVQENEELAIKYATLAANQGYIDAKKMLKAIEDPTAFCKTEVFERGNLIRTIDHCDEVKKIVEEL